MDTPRQRACALTVSDRRAAGQAEDTTGPVIAEWLREAGFDADTVVVPDGAESVERALREELAQGSRVIITTGGTGISPTDRTPEGTANVLDRELRGVMELLRRAGYDNTVYAVMTRGLCGIVEPTSETLGALIVNLPGSRGGVRDGLTALGPIVPHVLEQLQGGDHR